jgi:hypothetical protein
MFAIALTGDQYQRYLNSKSNTECILTCLNKSKIRKTKHFNKESIIIIIIGVSAVIYAIKMDNANRINANNCLISIMKHGFCYYTWNSPRTVHRQPFGNVNTCILHMLSALFSCLHRLQFSLHICGVDYPLCCLQRNRI